jgi:hypothetical protein
VLALVVSLVGVIALFAWIGYRHGPTLLRFTGIALWWAGWACGSQGGFGDMAVLLVLGTLAWAVGTRWYARRRGRWPSPLSARLLDRHTNRPTP